MRLGIKTWRLFVLQLIVNKYFTYSNLILISFEEEYTIRAKNECGIKTVKVMSTHIDNERICQSCFGALYDMIKYFRNKTIHASYFNFKISR